LASSALVGFARSAANIVACEPHQLQQWCASLIDYADMAAEAIDAVFDETPASPKAKKDKQCHSR
jgi:hypothetical protein